MDIADPPQTIDQAILDHRHHCRTAKAFPRKTHSNKQASAYEETTLKTQALQQQLLHSCKISVSYLWGEKWSEQGSTPPVVGKKACCLPRPVSKEQDHVEVT